MNRMAAESEDQVAGGQRVVLVKCELDTVSEFPASTTHVARSDVEPRSLNLHASRGKHS